MGPKASKPTAKVRRQSCQPLERAAGNAPPDLGWPGKNRLGDVDTMRRYIYIHGSPDRAEMGKPGSIGCVRMHNRDIVELFDLVPPYTQVEIRG